MREIFFMLLFASVASGNDTDGPPDLFDGPPELIASVVDLVTTPPDPIIIPPVIPKPMPAPLPPVVHTVYHSTPIVERGYQPAFYPTTVCSNGVCKTVWVSR